LQEPRDELTPVSRLTRGTFGVVSSYRGYRAPQGMLSWALHRLTGLGVLLFLFLHIIDIFLVGYGPELFNDLLFIYHHPAFVVGQLALIASVYYHAANGIRIILVDFWKEGYRYERQMFYAAMVVFFLAFIPTAFLMIRALIEHS
jgi:succinate dehydrogenase / fumarate reductase, cytochrome b subunit